MSGEGHIQILTEREVHAYELGTRPEVLDFIDSHAVWLAGLVEIGGYFGFGDINGWSYPRFTLGDNNRIAIETLAASLDATVHKDKHQESWGLYLHKGPVVAYLAATIGSYAPSRAEVFDDIINWYVAENREQRSKIAQLYLEYPTDRYECIYPQTYSPLVEKPEFCAGVFDGRESLGVLNDHWAHFRFASVNKALLESLRARFGGNVYTSSKAGEEKIMKKRTITPQRDSLRWQIGTRSEVSAFLKFIEPHVLLKRPDLERALALLD